jgi:hypothetical protein
MTFCQNFAVVINEEYFCLFIATNVGHLSVKGSWIDVS